MGDPIKVQPIDKDYRDKVVGAIFIAEGSNKTRWPYGIKSIVATNEAHAKRICERTVENNWIRYQKSPKTNDFLTYLGNVYCPKSADPIGNKNWIANIHKLVK